MKKKILVALLAIILTLSFVTVNSQPVSATSTSGYGARTESEIKVKLDELYSLLGNKYFNVGQDSGCGVKARGHGCENCAIYNIINSKWFVNDITNGNRIESSQIPNYGGKSCVGFAHFAGWYVFRSDNSDNVKTETVIENQPFTYDTISKYAHIGDYIWFAWGHAVVIYSIDTTGITVIDSNYSGPTYNCMVQKHKFNYNSNDKLSIKRFYSKKLGRIQREAINLGESTLSIYPSNYPTGTLNQGSTFALSGSVTSNYLIKAFSGEVLSDSGESFFPISQSVNSTCLYIRRSKVDMGLKFAELQPGTYRLKYTATDEKKTETWVSSPFTISGSTQSCTIAFNTNGGIESFSSKSVARGSVIGVTDTPTRPGYLFDGWYDAPQGGTRISEATTIYENKTLYAHWEKEPENISITFDANGGKVSLIITSIEKNTSLKSLPTPTLSGYSFDGWFDSQQGGTKITTSTIFSNDTTLYARWNKIEETITVTFNASGGSVYPSSTTLTKDTAIDVLPSPTRNGYLFGGWFDSAQGGTQITGSTIIRGDTTLYAHWEKEPEYISITFDANGGDVSLITTSIEKNSSLKSLPTPTRYGYSFDGWFDTPQGGTRITTSTTFSNKTTLYAHWSIIDNKITVVFDANGGDVYPTDTTIQEGKTIGTLPTPTRSGYTFDGWYDSRSGGSKVSGSTNFSKSTTLYAHWTEIPQTVLVLITFDANGGDVYPTDTTIQEGKSIGTLPTPTRSGYTFDGWYDSRSGGTKVSGSTNFSKSTTLYAHWTEIPKTIIVLVTLDANGGEVSQSRATVIQGEAIGTLPTPTRSGYSFDGWYDSRSGGSKVNASTTFSDNTTIYAHWTESTRFIRITFDANGGGVYESGAMIPDGQAVGSLPTPTRSDYIFDGWYDSRSGGSKITTSTTFRENTTIYAHWTKEIAYVIVTFDANGGEVYPTNATVLEGEAVGSLPTPTRSGYTFDGWYNSISGGSKVTSSTAFSTPATIYAHWSEIPVTRISFNSLTTPGDLTEGSGGHVDGSISSTGSSITSVSAEVYNSSTGRMVLSAFTSGFSQSTYGPIRGSKIDNDLTFGSLSAGTYYIKYTANCADGTQESQNTSTFRINEIPTDPGKGGNSNSVSFNSLTSPGNLKAGNGAHIDGSITSSGAPIVAVRAYVIDESTGDIVLSASTSGFSLSTYGPIRGSKIDNDLTFGSLPVGTYHIQYAVSLSDGTLEVGITPSFQVYR